jgi:hypothetical protein
VCGYGVLCVCIVSSVYRVFCVFVLILFPVCVHCTLATR